MTQKFLDSGYKTEELLVARSKALALDRETLLGQDRKKNKNDSLITLVINHDPAMKKILHSYLKDNDNLLRKWIGDKKVIISERRSPNTADLLFAKSAFSREKCHIKSNQKCNSPGCLTCKVVNVPKVVTLNNIKIKVDYKLNCKDENCIYLAICRLCDKDPQFYFGKTTTACNIRMNGHRGCFKMENMKYAQSALSYHIYTNHPESFGDKLDNFNIGVVKRSSHRNINRSEDYYIYTTGADKFSLNRYKVLR